MQRCVVIDYGSGNLRSVAKALEKAAPTSIEITISGQAEDIAKADRIVLPGVGAFADCHKNLVAIPGMMEALRSTVLSHRRPFLGICVGMQLLAKTGIEHGTHEGLDWLGGTVTRLSIDQKSASGRLKIPNMGWRPVVPTRDHKLFTGLDPNPWMYFVHSYVLNPAHATDLLATADYGGPITAAVLRDNIAGTQFHPEKSQAQGLRFLENFLLWTP